MQREYTTLRTSPLQHERAVNDHLAERTSAGWRLEHVTDRYQRGLIAGGYDFGFFWVRDDQPPEKSINLA